MKLEYDQCFYKYIEQKTKELFMSINSVNGISQMQNAQGVSFGSSNQDDGSGIDIGKLLAGGVAVAVAAGVGIAGYKSGQKLSAFKKDDGVLTTAWNGIKSWFGKNAQAANKIPAECKTSLKTLLSDGKISLEAKHNIIANADEISEVFSEKAKRNAQKADKLVEIAKIKDNKEKTNALADFFKIEKKLKLTTDDKLDITGLSLDDQAKITRKLKNTDGNSITGNSIDEIINGLKIKYKTKHENYDTAVGKIKDIRVKDIIKDSDVFKDTTIRKCLNRAGVAQDLAEKCEDSLSYINTQNSLTKWLKAGDLTQDEYDNLRALAEQKFMSKNGDNYLNYMTQGLKKTNHELINVNDLDDESIKLLNDEFKGLNINKASSGKKTSLTAQQLIDWKRNNTKSISEYLGFNGAQIPSGWTIENNALHFKGSSTPSMIKIGGKEISKFDDYKNMSRGDITGYTITLDKLKTLLNTSSS